MKIPHNLNNSLIVVKRSSVLGKNLFSVWITTSSIEANLNQGSQFFDILHRQGICVGDGLNEDEANSFIKEYCKQLNIKNYLDAHLSEGI